MGIKMAAVIVTTLPIMCIFPFLVVPAVVPPGLDARHQPGQGEMLVIGLFPPGGVRRA